LIGSLIANHLETLILTKLSNKYLIIRIKAPYEHQPTQFPKKYDTRDQNGKVKIKPRKFYTRSNKDRLFSNYEFMADPYDRLK